MHGVAIHRRSVKPLVDGEATTLLGILRWLYGCQSDRLPLVLLHDHQLRRSSVLGVADPAGIDVIITVLHGRQHGKGRAIHAIGVKPLAYFLEISFDLLAISIVLNKVEHLVEFGLAYLANHAFRPCHQS